MLPDRRLMTKAPVGAAQMKRAQPLCGMSAETSRQSAKSAWLQIAEPSLQQKTRMLEQIMLVPKAPVLALFCFTPLEI